jgi:hypothetical protein
MVVGEATNGVRVSISEKFTAFRFVKVKLPDSPEGPLVFDNANPVVPAVLTIIESPGDAGGVGLPPATLTVTVALGVILKRSFPSAPFRPRVPIPVKLVTGAMPVSVIVPALLPVGLKVIFSPAEVPLTVNVGLTPVEVSFNVSTLAKLTGLPFGVTEVIVAVP